MVEPRGHRILVKPVEVTKEITTKSGITLYKADQTVDMEQAGVDRGTVLALGETAYRDLGGHPWVKVGDTIVWPRYAGKPFEDSDIGLVHFLNDEDVLGVITDG